MGTPWDRAAVGYLEEWGPRFVPYHLDLVRKLALTPGDRVLVVTAGPGSEVLAAARAVGDHGFVRATDRNAEMVRLCREQVERAHLGVPIECAEADAEDARGGPWDAVICAFGLWLLPSPGEAIKHWGKALAPRGKVGILTWGPHDPGEPFERLRTCLRDIEPDYGMPNSGISAGRDEIGEMFDSAGLRTIRHTIVRHTLSFASAEKFIRAMRESCTWRRVWEELGDERFDRIATRFYDGTGGPGTPLSWDPPATLAIGALANLTGHFISNQRA